MQIWEKMASVVDSHENPMLGFRFFESTKCDYLLFYPQWQQSVEASRGIMAGVIYLLTVGILYTFNDTIKVTNPRGLEVIKMLKTFYNAFQVILCAWMFYHFTPLWFSNFGIDHVQTKEGEWAAIICFYSKIADFTDTFFMLFTGKLRQVTFLQLFHHATMPWHAANCIRCGWGRGTPLQSGWVNAFIHVMLYSHYLIRTFGFQNPFRRWITRCQLGQFWFLFSRAALGVIFLPEIRDFAIQDILYQGFMFFLFWAFYQKDKSRSKKKEK